MVFIRPHFGSSHFVIFRIELKLGLKNSLSMGNVSPCFVVPAGSMFTHVVMLLGVRSHRNLRMATRALEVKSVDFDSEIVHVEASFFSHVEFGADVQEVATGVAPHAHRQHHSNIILFVFFVFNLGAPPTLFVINDSQG